MGTFYESSSICLGAVALCGMNFVQSKPFLIAALICRPRATPLRDKSKSINTNESRIPFLVGLLASERQGWCE